MRLMKMIKCPFCGGQATLSKDPLDNNENAPSNKKTDFVKKGYVFFCIADGCKANPIHGFRLKISKLQKDRIMFDFNAEKIQKRVVRERGIRL